MSAELSYHRLKPGWLVLVALAFLIFVVIAAYSARMARDYPDYDQGRVQVRYQNLDKVNHDEGALLVPVGADGQPTAAWADQDKGLIKIPIDQAMRKEVADLKNQPAAQGCVIPGFGDQAAGTNAALGAAPASTNAAAATPPAPSNGALATPPASAKTAKSSKGKNTPPSAPDLQKKPASPSAPTVAPSPGATPATSKSTQYAPGNSDRVLPVFKTHPIQTVVWIHEGQNIWILGTLRASPPQED